MKLSQLRELIKNLPDDTEVILQDPDTYYLLIPTFYVDEDGLNITAEYTDEWKRP